MLDVQLGGLRGVMRRMVQVTLRGVRVVGRLSMVAGFVMLLRLRDGAEPR